MYAKGMGSFSGNYPWSQFSKFWVVMPIVLAVVGSVAVWLPLSTFAKTLLIGILVGLSIASFLIDSSNPIGESSFQSKIMTVLWGEIPILFPLAAWATGSLRPAGHDSTTTRANGNITPDR